MKATFVGGGAHRLFPILRAVLAEPGLFDGGEIHLYDPNVSRARVMGELLQRTPEFGRSSARITWGDSLDAALEGASAVGVVLMAGSPLTFALGNEACREHGFIGSDNVSPAGAFLAVKTAPILLNIARRMEQLCPEAWLLDFANPVAVMSALVNRHTRIRALGVCQGFTNHLWDLGRLFGKDEAGAGFHVEAAGINHLSFIVRGTRNGGDIFPQLDRTLGKEWTMPDLDPSWGEAMRKNIAVSVSNLVRFYRELGVLIFSTEPDGMAHLYHDEYVAAQSPLSRQEIEADVAASATRRAEANRKFESHLNRETNDAFWASAPPQLRCAGDDIFLRAFRGISGIGREAVATSRTNHGAIEGIPDDAVVEYSQILFRDKIEAANRYRLPAVVHGLVSALAVHQTMLADACAAEDPRLLAHALLAYPVRPYSQTARALYRDLLGVHRDEISPAFQQAADFLR